MLAWPNLQNCSQMRHGNTQNGSGKGEELYQGSGLLFFLNISYVSIPKLLGLDNCIIKQFISEKQQVPHTHTFSTLEK